MPANARFLTLHTGGVAGSIPAAPTIAKHHNPKHSVILNLFQDPSCGLTGATNGNVASPLGETERMTALRFERRNGS